MKTPYGAYTREDDPGEPSTGLARISVSTDEARILRYLSRGKFVLEIGTGLGVSTEAMAKTAAKVDTVDIDPWVAREIFGSLRADFKVRCHNKIPPQLSWDFVFIDAAHTDEDLKRDLADARKVCPRGMIVCHDSRQMYDTLAADKGDWLHLDTHHGIALTMHGF